MDINKDAAGIFVLAIFVSKDTWRLHFGNLHLYDWTRLLPFPPVAGSTCLEKLFLKVLREIITARFKFVLATVKINVHLELASVLL